MAVVINSGKSGLADERSAQSRSRFMSEILCPVHGKILKMSSPDLASGVFSLEELEGSQTKI